MNNTELKLIEVKNTLEAEQKKARSAWERGVFEYAGELFETLVDFIQYGGRVPESKKDLLSICLNGAENWGAYSWGGSSLICDSDIAERLCTLSELKRTKNGLNRPNSSEEWLDTQARALFQAFNKISSAARKAGMI